jgi:MFS family permease
MTLALPLFPLYWARVLNASDFWIGLINTVNNAVLLVAYFIWAELSRRRGAMLVLRICALGLASYPLLTGLTGVVPPLLVYAGLAGIFGAGLNLVLFDILLSTVPKERTASYVAIYQLTVYVATFIAPIVGAAISDAFGYAPALFVAAGVRLAGFVLFTILGVGALAAPVSASVPQQRRRAE